MKIDIETLKLSIAQATILTALAAGLIGGCIAAGWLLFNYPLFGSIALAVTWVGSLTTLCYRENRR